MGMGKERIHEEQEVEDAPEEAIGDRAMRTRYFLSLQGAIEET